MKKINISSKLRNYEVEFIDDIRSHLKKESKDDIFIIDKKVDLKIKLNKKKIIISPSEIEKNFSNEYFHFPPSLIFSNLICSDRFFPPPLPR